MRKQQEHKFLFTGTMGAGKTTAIAAVSEIPPIVTDVTNTDTTVAKARTTVGLDYGELTLEGGEKLKLYGTPGQERFAFMWDILARGALGLVILIDNSRPDPIADFKIYLTGFAKSLPTLPFVVGVGRTNAHPKPSIDDFADVLARSKLIAPVLAVDVRERQDVLLLVDVLLTQLESQNP
jgi:uncharacterized protein